MHILLGILLVVVGISYPMGALVWLNYRMGRRPTLSAGRVGLILAFDGVFPVFFIVSGLGVLMPRLWAILAIKAVVILTALATLILALAWFGVGFKSKPTTETTVSDLRSRDGR